MRDANNKGASISPKIAIRIKRCLYGQLAAHHAAFSRYRQRLDPLRSTSPPCPAAARRRCSSAPPAAPSDAATAAWPPASARRGAPLRSESPNAGHGAEGGGIEPGLGAARLDDRVNRLRRERFVPRAPQRSMARNTAPFAIPAASTPERRDRRPDQQDAASSSAAPVLVRPSTIDRQGRARSWRIGGIERHGRLDKNLLEAQAGDFAAAAPARGEGGQKQGLVARIDQPVPIADVRQDGRARRASPPSGFSARAAAPRPAPPAAARRSGAAKGPSKPRQRCKVPQWAGAAA